MNAIWATIIETDSPTTYNGPRFDCFDSVSDAVNDIMEFIAEEFDEEFPDLDAATQEYFKRTGRYARIERINLGIKIENVNTET